MQMSRQWMYGDRCHPDFIKGMHYFLRVAEANNRTNGFIYCPCSSCKNMKDYSTSKTIHVHLLENGFMPSYNCWTKHGERGVILEDNEEEEDSDNYPIFTADGDILRSENPEQHEDWMDGEHIKTFGGWLQTRLINGTDDGQLYLLAKQPS